MFIVCDVVVIHQGAERPTINHLQSTEDFLSRRQLDFSDSSWVCCLPFLSSTFKEVTFC